jgi:hypothetical protein
MHWYIKLTNIIKTYINTQHTSVIKNLPRRQYHIRVPPEVHPSIGELEYNLRHLSPYLRRLRSESSVRLRHHRGEPKSVTTASSVALVPLVPPIAPLGAASTPSPRNRPPGWSQMQTPQCLWTDNGQATRSSVHVRSNPKRTAHGPPPPSLSRTAHHH